MLVVAASELYKDPKAWATLVLAIAVLIIAISMARRMSTVSAKLGAIEVTATTIKEHTEQTVKAVNHVGKDEPTLIERVGNLEVDVADLKRAKTWEHDTLARLCHSTGVQITPSPTDRRTIPGGGS